MSKRLSITARRRSHLGFEQCENRRLLAGDTVVGDCDGDGVFDSADLVHVMQAGKFESGRLATAADGDWNEDGVFNAADLVHVFQQGHYGRRPAEMTDAIFAAQGRPDGVGQRPEGVRPDGVGQRPEGVGQRPEGVGFGRPADVAGGGAADRTPWVQAQIDRLQSALDSGELPEGISAEQVQERLTMLETALETGERPEGQRPDGVRPEGVGQRPEGVRPNGVGQRPEGIGQRPEGVGFGRPADVAGGGAADRTPWVQAQIDRLQSALDSGELPEGISAEQVQERLTMLETALETGERPEGQRPDGVSGGGNFGGRPFGRRPF